jgi:acetyl esterase/lipase
VDPLSAFNATMPKDCGARRVASGLAYGGDPRQVLDLYAPRGTGPHPVIVYYHGGGWSSGHRQGYAFVARALAARGFVVAVPDYRLVPQVHYPEFVRDGAAAVRWLRAHVAQHGGDGERIVLTGHSAGAYIAAMLALDPQWLGEDRSAVRGFAGVAGPYDFLPLASPMTIAAFGNWPALRETQPTTHVAPGLPPALLLHGEADTLVKPRNSILLAELLTQAGNDARLKLYPGIGHVGIITTLAMPLRWRAPVLADIVQFARDVT